jgi:hypothetical protein
MIDAAPSGKLHSAAIAASFIFYGGRANRAVAVTTMIANKWAVLACAGAQAAVSIGSGVFADVKGGVIVPPGYTIGLNAAVGTAVGTSLIGLSWHEVQLKLG